MLKKTFVLVLTLTIVFLAESSPASAPLDFDNLGIDYPDLEFERDYPMNFFKLFEVMTKTPTNDAKASKYDAESSAKASGSKKKNKTMKGVNRTHNSGDLNSFFKTTDAYNLGDYDDSNEYGKAAATAATVAATKAKETRTYARANKTTGFHRVHHKDEYKKDQEFYEKDERKGTINKAGAKALGTTVKVGAGFKTWSFKDDRQKRINGKEGYVENLFSDKQFSDFADSEDPASEFADELDVQF